VPQFLRLVLPVSAELDTTLSLGPPPRPLGGGSFSHLLTVCGRRSVEEAPLEGQRQKALRLQELEVRQWGTKLWREDPRVEPSTVWSASPATLQIFAAFTSQQPVCAPSGGYSEQLRS
jgi:hypothetical protein